MDINYLNSVIGDNLTTIEFDTIKIARYDLFKFPQLQNYINTDAFINREYISLTDLPTRFQQVVYDILMGKTKNRHIIVETNETPTTQYIMNKHNSFFKSGNMTVKRFVAQQILNFINTPYQTLPFLCDYGSRIKEKLQNRTVQAYFVKAELDTFVSKLNQEYVGMWLDLTVSDLELVDGLNLIDKELIVRVYVKLVTNDNQSVTFEVSS